jgi:hypothetical protein
MTTIEPLPEKLSPDEKRQRRRYISEARGAIERGDKAYAELGAALWALQDEDLYRDGGLTFPEFVHAEFGISKSNAYRCIEIAKAVQAHPELPIPSQYAIEQARPKASNRPKVGTVGERHPASDLPVPDPVPSVIDAEGWEEPEPKALPAPSAVTRAVDSFLDEALGPVVSERDTDAPDSPGATLTGQPEPQAGLTAPGGNGAYLPTKVYDLRSAEDVDAVAARYSPPNVKPLSPVEAFVDAFEDEPILTPPTRKGSFRRFYDGLTDRDPADMAAEASKEEYAVIMAWAQQFQSAWGAAHLPRAQMSRQQRATADAAKAKAAPKAKDSGGCDHQTASGQSLVTPGKDGKGMCKLCGESVEMAKVG